MGYGLLNMLAGVDEQQINQDSHIDEQTGRVKGLLEIARQSEHLNPADLNQGLLGIMQQLDKGDSNVKSK